LIAIYGRCRSGQRWFWAATCYDLQNEIDHTEHGFEDDEYRAIWAAEAAVSGFEEKFLDSERRLHRSLRHGHARDQLKHLNAEQRRSRPSPDSGDTQQIEYLYAHDNNSCHWDGNQCGCDNLEGRAKWDYHTDRFRITKKTAKRVYYIRSDDEWEPDGVVIGYVDRQKLEADGEVFNHGAGGWWSKDFHLMAAPPEPPSEPTPADAKAEVFRLRADMAAAHPDRGGTSEAFIEARSRYMAAKRGAR